MNTNRRKIVYKSKLNYSYVGLNLIGILIFLYVSYFLFSIKAIICLPLSILWSYFAFRNISNIIVTKEHLLIKYFFKREILLKWKDIKEGSTDIATTNNFSFYEIISLKTEKNSIDIETLLYAKREELVYQLKKRLYSSVKKNIRSNKKTKLNKFKKDNKEYSRVIVNYVFPTCGIILLVIYIISLF